MRVHVPLSILTLACCATPTPADDAPPKTALVVHGGAGVSSEQSMRNAGIDRSDIETELARALAGGHRALNGEGGSPTDAVEEAIRVLEDSPLFNAGRGAALTDDGIAELDAAIMIGRVEGGGRGTASQRKSAGAVAAVMHVKNPISAARAVMEMPNQKHVMLTGSGAEAFLFTDAGRREKYRLERVKNTYFWTERRVRQVAEEGTFGPRGEASYFGTVGAVARSGDGRLAAGTSTGGLSGKMPGRVGDAPLIGAGTYADDRACGVSCTGTGELFIRHAVAHDVTARMRYAGATVQQAAADAIAELPESRGGVGGLIALDKDGRHAFALSPNTNGMYRGYVTEGGDIYVAIFREEFKQVRLGE